MNIKRVYIFIFCLLSALPASTQVQNPFEIKSRIQADTSEVQVTEDQRSDNILPVAAENTTPQSSSSISEPSQPSEEAVEEINDQQNPFEIKAPKATQKKGHQEIIINKREAEKSLIDIPKELSDSSKQDNFLFWVILFGFLILAVGLSLDRWFITKLFKGILNYNLSNTMMREMTGFKTILLALLYLLFIVAASLFSFLLFRHFTGQNSSIYLIYSFAFIAAIYLVRHIGMHLLNIIFPGVPEAVHYSYSIVTFNVVGGILLLIPVLLMAYSSSTVALIAMFLGLFIIGILYLLRSFRGLLIAFRFLNNNPIHFFLYLCAFEIVPMLVIYKLLSDFV